MSSVLFAKPQRMLRRGLPSTNKKNDSVIFSKASYVQPQAHDDEAVLGGAPLFGAQEGIFFREDTKHPGVLIYRVLSVLLTTLALFWVAYNLKNPQSPLGGTLLLLLLLGIFLIEAIPPLVWECKRSVSPGRTKFSISQNKKCSSLCNLDKNAKPCALLFTLFTALLRLGAILAGIKLLMMFSDMLVALRYPSTRLALDLINYGFAGLYAPGANAPRHALAMSLPSSAIQALPNPTSSVSKVADLLAFVRDNVLGEDGPERRDLLLFGYLFGGLRLLQSWCNMGALYYESNVTEKGKPVDHTRYTTFHRQRNTIEASSVTLDAVLLLGALTVHWRTHPNMEGTTLLLSFLGYLPSLFALLSLARVLVVSITRECYTYGQLRKLTRTKNIAGEILDSKTRERVPQRAVFHTRIWFWQQLFDTLLTLGYIGVALLQWITLRGDHSVPVYAFVAMVTAHQILHVVLIPYYMLHNDLTFFKEIEFTTLLEKAVERRTQGGVEGELEQLQPVNESDGMDPSYSHPRGASHAAGNGHFSDVRNSPRRSVADGSRVRADSFVNPMDDDPMDDVDDSGGSFQGAAAEKFEEKKEHRIRTGSRDSGMSFQPNDDGSAWDRQEFGPSGTTPASQPFVSSASSSSSSSSSSSVSSAPPQQPPRPALPDEEDRDEDNRAKALNLVNRLGFLGPPNLDSGHLDP